MKDIGSREDIDRLMVEFYDAAFADESIGYIFTDVAKMDLDEHLPVIGDFWESVVFGSGVYAKRGRNPMVIHHQLSQRSTLLPEHFDRWLQIFSRIVDENFEGERADLIKMRAHSIANRMVENICGNSPVFIAQENPATDLPLQ